MTREEHLEHLLVNLVTTARPDRWRTFLATCTDAEKELLDQVLATAEERMARAVVAGTQARRQLSLLLRRRRALRQAENDDALANHPGSGSDPGEE